jgi:5-methylthioadenosine/S-adenosylhomocysteine deaminase
MQGGVANVDTVLIAGRLMKRNGVLLYPDMLDKKAELARSGDRILRDFGLSPRHAA